MKFVIDEQLPPALTDWLRLRGHEAVHVRDVGLKSSRDEAISQYAKQNSCIVVTKDEDFRSQSLDVESVLWLRIGNVTNKRLLSRLEADWPAIERMLASGGRIVEVR